jgi:hypothetical protein
MTKKHSQKAIRARRLRLPLRPEFAYTGIVAGGTGGLVISVIMEVALNQPRQIIMTVGAMVGLIVGSATEGLRYAWRIWRWKVACARIRQTESEA